jgi:hypothetical protein
LPDLAADLVRRQVAVIAATDSPSTVAAKAATTTIPIVFMSGGDPIQLGPVASLNRPGGNVTGVTFLVATLAAKLLGLLRDLLPQAARIAVLTDPNMPVTESFVSDAQRACAHAKFFDHAGPSEHSRCRARTYSVQQALIAAWSRPCWRCATPIEPGALNRRPTGRGTAPRSRSALCLMSLTAWTRPRRLALEPR